jgi:hypothetical protein
MIRNLQMITPKGDMTLRKLRLSCSAKVLIAPAKFKFGKLMKAIDGIKMTFKFSVPSDTEIIEGVFTMSDKSLKNHLIFVGDMKNKDLVKSGNGILSCDTDLAQISDRHPKPISLILRGYNRDKVILFETDIIAIDPDKIPDVISSKYVLI